MASRIIFLARVSGNNKLFQLDLATNQRTQLTFGTHDEAAPQFLDKDTLVFASTAVSPTEPIDPEVAKNGNIFNIWTLTLKNGELKQYTDAVGGNLSPAVLAERQAAARRVRQLLQGRVLAADARAPRAAADGARQRLRRAAGAGHRLHAAAPAHDRGREQAEEGHGSRRCSSMGGRR